MKTTEGIIKINVDQVTISNPYSLSQSPSLDQNSQKSLLANCQQPLLQFGQQTANQNIISDPPNINCQQVIITGALQQKVHIVDEGINVKDSIQLTLKQQSEKFLKLNFFCFVVLVLLLIYRTVIYLAQKNDAYSGSVFYGISLGLFIFTTMFGYYGVKTKQEFVLWLYYQIGMLQAGAFEIVGSILGILNSKEVHGAQSPYPYSCIQIIIIMLVVLISFMMLVRQSTKLRILMIRLVEIKQLEQARENYETPTPYDQSINNSRPLKDEEEQEQKDNYKQQQRECLQNPVLKL